MFLSTYLTLSLSCLLLQLITHTILQIAMHWEFGVLTADCITMTTSDNCFVPLFLMYCSTARRCSRTPRRSGATLASCTSRRSTSAPSASAPATPPSGCSCTCARTAAGPSTAKARIGGDRSLVPDGYTCSPTGQTAQTPFQWISLEFVNQ